MHPGLSEKGMVNNAVLVDCLERAALVNYQEVFKLFVSQHPGEGKCAQIAALVTWDWALPYLHPQSVPRITYPSLPR